MSILTADEILLGLDARSIKIEPFRIDQLNPCSYDVRLGSEVAVYTNTVWHDPQAHTMMPDGSTLEAIRDRELDAKVKNHVNTFKMDSEMGWLLKPGIGYLMATEEVIHTDSFVTILDGKSSIGRLFIDIHATAGFGDPGFEGQYTLEVSVVHPVRVYPGMRIGQVRFEELGLTKAVVPIDSTLNYQKRGNYVGPTAIGPIPSQSWKQS